MHIALPCLARATEGTRLPYRDPIQTVPGAEVFFFGGRRFTLLAIGQLQLALCMVRVKRFFLTKPSRPQRVKFTG